MIMSRKRHRQMDNKVFLIFFYDRRLAENEYTDLMKNNNNGFYEFTMTSILLESSRDLHL